MSNNDASAALDRAYQYALEHLTASGHAMITVHGVERQRWSPNTLAHASRLLHAYFYGPRHQIAALEQGLNHRVLRNTRGKFATACILNPGVQRTPGQAQSWFERTHRETEAYYRSHHQPKGR